MSKQNAQNLVYRQMEMPLRTDVYEDGTTLAVEVTSTIPTEVLPTVITASTTSSTTSTTAEVGGIVVLPFTGSSEGALLGFAIGLVALGTIVVTAVRGSRTED